MQRIGIEHKTHSLRLCQIVYFDANAKNGLYTDSLHLTQHPIDAMLQFDTNTNSHAHSNA